MTISRMMYLDDSGSESSGLIVYGWVECCPARWRHALRAVLELRKELYRRHRVHPSTELHATEFVNGRGRIADIPDSSGVEWKELGRAVARETLAALARTPDIRIGAVARRTEQRGRAYFEEKADVYRCLVELLDADHREAGTFVLLNMDGDGSDPAYKAAHRSLPLDSRHVIEDPVFHNSQHSQLVQMADLVAYTTFIGLNPHRHNEHARGWYSEYLAESDVGSGPMRL